MSAPLPVSLPEMHAFFQHTRRTVTLEDIQNHALNDPGYPRYVHALNSIRESGHIPSKASFHLSEPIELAGFGDANSVRDPEGFRRFRRFTTAIALVLVAQGWDDHAPNYIVHRLLLDSPAGDSDYMNLARGALNELVTVLKPAQDVFGVSNEYPFLIAYWNCVPAGRAETKTGEHLSGAVLWSGTLLSDEGISCFQSREAAEIPIHRPKFAHPAD